MAGISSMSDCLPMLRAQAPPDTPGSGEYREALRESSPLSERCSGMNHGWILRPGECPAHTLQKPAGRAGRLPGGGIHKRVNGVSRRKELLRSGMVDLIFDAHP